MAAIDAAAILVTARDGTVLLGERSMQMAFLGGYCAFPGGALEEADRRAGARLGIDPLICCAIREMIEETGIVVDGARVRPVREEERDLPLEELGVRIEGKRFEHCARWIPPDYAPIDYRFDTRFFLFETEETCGVVPREFAWARFEKASSWLDRWKRFEIILVPPTLLGLQALEHGSRGAA